MFNLSRVRPSTGQYVEVWTHNNNPFSQVCKIDNKGDTYRYTGSGKWLHDSDQMAHKNVRYITHKD